MSYSTRKLREDHLFVHFYDEMHLFIEKSPNNSFPHNLTMICDKYTNNNNNNKGINGCDKICEDPNLAKNIRDINFKNNFGDDTLDDSDSEYEFNESDVTLVDDLYDDDSPKNEAQRMFFEVVEVLRFEQEVKNNVKKYIKC